VGERAEDIRGEDKAEEEDLVEVVVMLFVITMGHNATMHKSVRMRHAHPINIASILSTLSKNVLC